MATMVNIPRGHEDPNYRYKMPRLSSKIEGRGNGIKTNISNMGEIARALRRPPMYPTKFFGCELGAMAKFEEAEEKALINGAHNEKDLVIILDKFVEMYVLCQICKLPESDILVKRGLLVSKCNACGGLSNLDITHKAATYMIKNPPNQSSSTVGGKDKKHKDKTAYNVKRSKETGYDSEEGKKLKKDKKLKDKKLKKKKVGSTSDDEGVTATESRDGNTNADVSAKGSNSIITNSCDEKKKKKKKKSPKTEKVLEHEDLEYDSAEIDEIVDRFKAFLSKNEATTVKEFTVEIRKLQVAQHFNSKCRVFVGLSSLFDESLTPEILDSKMEFVETIKNSAVRASDFIDALEYFCVEKSSDSLKKYPFILQRLYNAEVLDAEDILNYYQNESSSTYFIKCQELAQPFLSWLGENESEEEYDATESSTPTEAAVFKPLNVAADVAVPASSKNENIGITAEKLGELCEQKKSIENDDLPLNSLPKKDTENVQIKVEEEEEEGVEEDEEEFHDALDGDESDIDIDGI